MRHDEMRRDCMTDIARFSQRQIGVSVPVSRDPALTLTVTLPALRANPLHQTQFRFVQ